jgi:hypothetical protein
MSDRINLKIGSVTFVLAPLNYLRKQEISACTRLVAGEEHFDLLKAQATYLKYAVKDIIGLTNYNGDEYKPELQGDCLTEDAVSELLNLDQRSDLTTCAWQILNGIQELTDLETGKKMEGVELEVVSQKK